MRRTPSDFTKKRHAFLTRPQLESLEPRHPLAAEILNPVAGDPFSVLEFEVLENSPQVFLNALSEQSPTAHLLGLGSAGGQVSLSPDSRYITYQPRPGFSGIEGFEGRFGPSVKVHVLKAATDDTFTVRPDGNWQTFDVTSNDAWFQRNSAGRITTIDSSSDQADFEIVGDGKQVRFRFRSDRGPLDPVEIRYGFEGVHFGKATVTPETPIVNDMVEVVQDNAPAVIDPLANDTFWAGYTGARRITQVRSSYSESQATVGISPDGSSVQFTTPPLVGDRFDSLEYVVDNQFKGIIAVTISERVRPDTASVKVNAERAYIPLTENDGYLGPASNGLVLAGGRVTSVTGSTRGATIEIAPDGQGVYYRPPLDFFGQDKFEYVTEFGFRQKVVVAVEHQIDDTTVAGRRDGQSQIIDVLAGFYGDRPSNTSYRITSVMEPWSGGTATIVNNQIRYTPPAGDVTENLIGYIVDGVDYSNIVISGPSTTSPDAEFKFCNPASSSYTLDVLRKLPELPATARIASATVIEKRPEDGTLAVSPDGRSLELTPTVLRDLSIRIVLQSGDVYKVNVKWPKLQSDFLNLDNGPLSLDVVANDRSAWPCSGDDGTTFSYDGPWKVTSVEGTGVASSMLAVQDGTIVLAGPMPYVDSPIYFRYVVDGRLEGSLQLTTARLAVPDHVLVQPGKIHRIPVLSNDSISRYETAKITQVTGSQFGATVEIIDDGTAVLYRAPQAPRSPTAPDTFTYTVNDRYTATVEVQVKSDSPERTDATLVAIAENLLAKVATRELGHPFGSDTNGSSFHCSCATMNGGFESPGNGAVSPLRFVPLETDSLSVQAQGLIYAAIGEDLVILENEGRDQLREIGRMKIGGAPLSIYQAGTRLTLVSGVHAYGTSWNREETSLDSIYNETRVTVIDTANARQPRVIQSTQTEGRLRGAQFVDGKVRIVLEQVKMPPLPKIVTSPIDGQLYYERSESYVARAQDDLATFLQDSVPNYVSYDGNGIIVRSGMLHTTEEMYRSLDEGADTLYSFLTVDPQSNEPGVVAAIAGYATPWTIVFLGDEHAYLLHSVLQGTRIQRVDWGTQGTDPTFDATMVLTAQVASADYLREHHGTLIAVVGPLIGSVATDAKILTIQKTNGMLEVVGQATSATIVSSVVFDKGIRLNGSVLQVPGLGGIEFFDVGDATNPHRIAQMPNLPFQRQLHWLDGRYFVTTNDSKLELWDAIDKNAPAQIASEWLARSSDVPPHIDYDAASGLVTLTNAIEYDVTNYQDPLTNQHVSYETASVVATYRVTLPSAGGGTAKVEFIGDYHVPGTVIETLAGTEMVTFTDRSVVKAKFLSEGVQSVPTSGLLQAPTRFEPPTVAELLAQANIAARVQSVRAAMASSVSPALEASRVFPIATEWRRGAMDVILDGTGPLQYWREQNGQTTRIATDFAFATASDYTAALTWHNEANALDVNGDGFLSPIDALLIINQLNAQEATALAQGVAHHQLAAPRSTDDPFWDSSNDGYVSPIDAILVINELEVQSRRKNAI